MNDDELDQTIRSGLASLINQAHVPAPYPADATPGSDTPHEAARRSSGTRRIRYLSIAAALVAVVGVSVWTISDNDRGGIDAVDDGADEPSGFAGWEPGWHTLDPGPVPAMNGAQLTWTGERLIVSGRHFPSAGETTAQVFSYDPATRDWTELPRPPSETNRIVSAGDDLVVVGFDDEYPAEPVSEWATLAAGADEWTTHGAVPQSAVLAQAGVTGIGAGRDQLLWTGERVIDFGLGAVLDPVTGNATELPMPADIIAYTQLLSATPVWTGEQAVLSSWSTGPGLVWDATGTDWQDVPGPVVGDWPPSSGSAAPAALLGSDVIVVSEGTENAGYSASLDPATGEWTRLVDIPAPSNVTCPYRLAVVADTPVVQPCDNDYGTPLRLFDGGWSEIGSAPFDEDCCMGTWLGTDDALIMWSTDVDTLNNPRAPYVEAAVWIPPSDSSSNDEPTDETPDAERSDDTTTADGWQSLPAGPADGRVFPVFEWAGDRLVIWGGETTSEVEWTDTGAIYDPATQTWSEMSDGPLGPRSEASAVWTGTELFICCGRNPAGDEETATAAYDPETDSWRELPPAPTTVAFGTAVWTGSNVLIIGPGQVGFPDSPTVAMTFDPTTEEWRELDGPPAALGLEPPVSWTGDDAIVWTHHTGGVSTGYRLDVDNGTWQQLPPVPDDLAIDAPSMVATATDVLIWGPPTDSPTTSAGAVLDRTTGTWGPMSDDPLNSGEDWNGVPGSHNAVWTGTEMLIWTGAVAAPQSQLDTRIIAYTPATDTWRELDRAGTTAHRPQLALREDLLAIGTLPPSSLSLGS